MTIEAMASLCEARMTDKARAAALRRAQKAAQEQAKAQGQQCQQTQQGSGTGVNPQGQQQKQLSPCELGANSRNRHQAGQQWQGFQGGKNNGCCEMSPDAQRAMKERVYGACEPGAAEKNVDTKPKGAVQQTGDAAADAAKATGPQTNAPKTAAKSYGAGAQRQFRGFRDISEDKLKQALPKNAQHLAKAFIDAGRKHNIDPVMLAAISKHETGNFTSSAFRNKNNAMGISNRKGPIHMSSAEASIDKMAKHLADPKGYYKNAKTVADLAKIYAPQGAANDPLGLNGHWPRGVSKYADQIERAVLS